MDCNQSMYNYLISKIYDREDYSAMLFCGSEIKMSTLINQIEKLAGALAVYGVKKGDKVVLCLPNIPNAIIAFYAINKIGAIANVVDYNIPSGSLAKIIKSSEAKFVFMMDNLIEKYQADLSLTNAKIVVCCSSTYINGFKGYVLKKYAFIKYRKVYNNLEYFIYSDLIEKGIKIEGENSGKAVATYMHSGGTTGEAKTVMLSNASINTHTESVAKMFENNELNTDDAVLMALPLVNGFGFGAMHFSLCFGTKLALVPQSYGHSINTIIKRKKVTVLVGIPSLYAKLVSQPNFKGKYLKNLKYIFCGGDRIPTSVKEKINNQIKECDGTARIFEGYGLTELVSVCSVNTKQNFREGSVGKAIDNVKIAIVDENNELLPPNHSGEICITGKTLMQGYVKDNKANELAFVNLKQGEQDAETFIKTGDFGYLDQDGYLYYVDRMKRMIKISDGNVYPAQIEDVVLKLKEVKECCAIRSEMKGKKCIKLLVVAKNPEMQNEETTNIILEHCKKFLFRYAIPKQIIYVKNLPLTSVGKVDYVSLEKVYID